MGWVDLGISPGSWWRGDETWHSLYIYNCIMNNYMYIYKMCLIFWGGAHAIEVHSCARIVLGTNAHMGSCGSLTKQNMAWSPGDFTGSILQQIVLISTWFNPNTHQHASRIWESGNISCHPQQDSAAICSASKSPVHHMGALVSSIPNKLFFMAAISCMMTCCFNTRWLDELEIRLITQIWPPVRLEWPCEEWHFSKSNSSIFSKVQFFPWPPEG